MMNRKRIAQVASGRAARTFSSSIRHAVACCPKVGGTVANRRISAHAATNPGAIPVITAAQAHSIITFFCGKGSVGLPVAGLTPAHVAYAQAMLEAGLQASKQTALAFDLFATFNGAVKLQTVLKRFAGKIHKWLRAKDGAGINAIGKAKVQEGFCGTAWAIARDGEI
jgi:hypothetical protein